MLAASDAGPRLPLDEILAEETPDTAIYTCGPALLVDAVQTATGHWTSGSVRTERFKSSAIKPHRPNIAHTVLCARSSKAIDVPADTSILRALDDAGINVPSSCRDGVCGSCEVRVLAGTPEHRDDILAGPGRQATDRTYPCVSRATTHELTLVV